MFYYRSRWVCTFGAIGPIQSWRPINDRWRSEHGFTYRPIAALHGALAWSEFWFVYFCRSLDWEGEDFRSTAALYSSSELDAEDVGTALQMGKWTIAVVSLSFVTPARGGIDVMMFCWTSEDYVCLSYMKG